jgi:hypothetical protein
MVIRVGPFHSASDRRAWSATVIAAGNDGISPQEGNQCLPLRWIMRETVTVPEMMSPGARHENCDCPQRKGQPRQRPSRYGPPYPLSDFAEVIRAGNLLVKPAIWNSIISPPFVSKTRQDEIRLSVHDETGDESDETDQESRVCRPIARVAVRPSKDIAAVDKTVACIEDHPKKDNGDRDRLPAAMPTERIYE